MGQPLGGLPNQWHFFNLQESPYFQATLGDAPARHPLSLFVGRATEVRQLLAGIGGARSSRQAVGGPPGVGKTTLVQLVKATAVANGYWATTDLIPFYPDDTADRVIGRMLEAVYEAVLAARPHMGEQPAMQRAQQYVRAFRLTGGGANLSVLGVGAGASRSTAAVTPSAGLLIEGPRVLRDLLGLATANAQGVVLHLDNLENLAERDLAEAADILRSLRDPVLLQDGLHVLLVGTGEAVTATCMAHPQLRSVVSLVGVEAMPVTDVQALLAARYRHLVLDPAQPVLPPVAPRTVAQIYSLFRGDLRGLLKALEEGVSLLAGLVGKRAGAPIPLGALREALQQRYASLLAQAVGEARQRQLARWAESLGPRAAPTQQILRGLWGISQPAVSQALAELGAAGYVVARPRRGLEPTTYALTGPSRLIFG
jgi:DNA-binding transcriptional ArsR family regulator